MCACASALAHELYDKFSLWGRTQSVANIQVSVLTFISDLVHITDSLAIIYLIDHIPILNNAISISRIMKYELMTDSVRFGVLSLRRTMCNTQL